MVIFKHGRFASTGLILACLGLLVATTAVEAKPKVTVKNKTYKVDATTIDGLRKQMKQLGPNGFWAFTDWYVQWTDRCKLSVTVTYTLPKHLNEAKLEPGLRKRWKAMVKALTRHEHNHGNNGIRAAQEIEMAKCSGGDAIIKKWNKIDKAYDKRTKHGKTEGVVLQ